MKEPWKVVITIILANKASSSNNNLSRPKVLDRLVKFLGKPNHTLKAMTNSFILVTPATRVWRPGPWRPGTKTNSDTSAEARVAKDSDGNHTHTPAVHGKSHTYLILLDLGSKLSVKTWIRNGIPSIFIKTFGES